MLPLVMTKSSFSGRDLGRPKDEKKATFEKSASERLRYCTSSSSWTLRLWRLLRIQHYGCAVRTSAQKEV